MTKRIRILDEQTINKIAAGEVIENPSSVVKELVENALDAGADDIHVEIQCGGRQLIRIADNGCGMSQDDAILCLERYATSKIREVDDLNSLLTMGFRGEALPSIASISKLTLLTAVKDREGTLLMTEGGQLLRCCGAAREHGTTIEVKSLFFNMPVRQKFQKSPAYDIAAIQKVVHLQALSHPRVRFTLISDQKQLLVAPKAASANLLDSLLQRVSVVLGSEFVDAAIPVEAAMAGCEIRGLISIPTSHRPNRAQQYLMINHRAVTSMLVSMAVRDGYGTALPTQRYPAFVLDLTLPGDLLDVNVHPQKSEVRLRNEQHLRDFLRNAISVALQADGKSIAVPAMMCAESLFHRDTALPPLPWDLPRQATGSAPPPALQENVFHEEPVSAFPKACAFPAVTVTPQVLTTVPGYAVLDPCFTSHLNEDHRGGLWILDQRAAHHRILFDRLTAQQSTGEIEQFLIPMTLTLSSAERVLVEEALPDLQRLGFQLEPFGPTTLCLRAIPCEFRGIDVQNLVVELVQELRDYQSLGLINAERRKRLSLKASQAALTRQQQLSLAAASQLLKELFQCENPYRCPNGNQTLICLDAQRFAKLFQS